MNIILLSGGSGKRLWPLSNDTRSKQFLKLLKGENGNFESMVQRVYGQIRKAGIEANIVIATRAAQVDSIKSQLGDSVDIVVEPERRDTFPAIALASAYLALEKKTGPDEAVITVPVDPYADIDYFYTLLEMERAIRNNAADIVLMGIEPSYPSEKYGYILPEGAGYPRKVKRFIEKPPEKDAEKFIADGAVWNGGVFAFKLGYMMNLINRRVDAGSFEEIREAYSRLPKISFDYEVVEKANSLAVVSYSGIWKDLGTWNTLSEEMDEPYMGGVIVGEETQNTHVINELDIPVVVLGAKNMVIAASPDGILVSDKHRSSYLKPYVDAIDRRPMFEERRWGEYKVLDYVAYGDGIKSLTKHLIIKAGQTISYQKHSNRDEIWTIVNGTGELLMDGHVRNVRRGDVAYIIRGQLHAIRAVTDLHFVEVQIGSELVEEDIERFEFEW